MRAIPTCIVLAGIALLYLPGPTNTPPRIPSATALPGPADRHTDRYPPQPETISIASPVAAQVKPEESRQTPDAGSQAILWGSVQTENGVTVPGAKISLYTGAKNENHIARSGASGDFLFENLRPAVDYRISVNPHGMYKRYLRVMEIDPNETHLNIVLETLPTGQLSGRIVDINGNPIPEFRLSLRSKIKPTWSRHVATDSLGQFHIPEFPLGPYEVTSMSGLLLTITGLRFTGETQPVELTVDSGPYSITGRIYDHMGNPLGGAGVFLDWTFKRGEVRNFTARRTATDPDGRFSINGIGEGAHDLLLVASRESVYRREIDLGRESGRLDVVMDIPGYPQE